MILITGGAGYIGSHMNKLMSENGYETVIFDSLVHGHVGFAKWGTFVQGDLCDIDALDAVFRTYSIEAVMHFAAFAYVGESVTHPAKYYRNNVMNTINLLDTMQKYGCDKLIFSSTCATYGSPKSSPITENTKQEPINPYGKSKLMVEQILCDYATAYGLKFVALRYFNASGSDPYGQIGECHVPETHLIPLVLEAALNETAYITVFGDDYSTPDGTCIRDYTHVADLAKAHLLALQYLERGGASDSFNLGSGVGTSVSEVIEAAKTVTNKAIRTRIAARRQGDPAELIASSKKAESVLGWQAEKSDIHTILSDAWRWRLKTNSREPSSQGTNVKDLE